MPSTNNPKTAPLLKLGEPKRREWPDYIKTFAFTEEDVPALIALACNQALHQAPGTSAQVWAPLHAWRALGQLRAEAAILPLMGLFTLLCDDDTALSELHEVFGLIGPAAIPPVADYFCETTGKNEFSLVMALDALAEIGKVHGQCRDKVVAHFQRYMQQPLVKFRFLNGLLMGRLLDLDAVELIDDIRRLFALNCVDISCAGDLEDVEILLGLRSERSTPKVNPYAEMLARREIALDDFGDDAFFDDNLGDDVFYTPPMLPNVRTEAKIGRNDPCPCGSGKKYKKCCGN